MAHPLKPAESSARKFGGKAEDYVAIANWFDESKAFFPDFRHRALRHHAEGIFLAEKLFGVAVVNSDGCKSPSAMWESSTSGRILAGFRRPKVGYRKLGHSPGWMARD